MRRLRRASVRRLRALAGPDRLPDLAAHLPVPTPADLAARLRAARAARGPLEPSEFAQAREELIARFPSHSSGVLARADRVLSGEVHLFGEWRENSRGTLADGVAALAWTRDPLHGGLSPERPSRELDRDAPGTDARATWECARLAPIAWLAQAHLLAGRTAARGRPPGIYARAAVLHVRDFLATQPPGWGLHWTCPMEAALRVLNLAPALLLLRSADDVDAQFWGEALVALWRHGRFIEDALEDSSAVPNNHLLANLAALAALGLLFPELPGALTWRSEALPAFARELLRQTTPDGFSFESSLAYHGFATELGLVVESFARRQGLGLQPEARARLGAMCRLVARATLPDGSLPHLGDDDGSRAMPWELRGALQLPHLASVGAALGLPGLDPPAVLCPEVIWVTGLQGLRRLAGFPRARPGAVHERLGGLAVVSSGSAAATIWAGSNGQRGLGGHAHNDKLSCEVVLRGRRLVVDPGCPTYLAPASERDQYRATAAHPTIVVDGQEQVPIPEGRPFLLPDAAGATLLRVEPSRALAEHRGYERLRPSVVHRREVLLLERPSAVCIVDRLLGEGTHTFELRWPLPFVDARVHPPSARDESILSAIEGLSCGEGRVSRALVVTLSPDAGPPFLVVFASELQLDPFIEPSVWSPGYGRRSRGATIVVRARTALPCALTTYFVDGSPVAAVPDP